MAFSSVRIEKLKSVAQFQNIHAHGMRADASSERRVDRDRTFQNIAWSKGENPLDVMGALQQRKTELGGAKPYGKAAFGAHLLLIVSPEWIKQAGDLHDPKNPNNLKLFKAAAAWSEEKFGRGSVIAARMDMDEAGGGVVDIVVVPHMTKKVGGKEVNYLSLNKSFEAVFGKGRLNYRNVQSSWNEYCKQNLDHEIERGVSKDITGAEHVHSEIMAPALEMKSEAKKELDEAEKQRETAKKQAEQNQRDAAENERQRAEIERLRVLTEKREAEAAAALEHAARENEKNRRWQDKLIKYRDALVAEVEAFKREKRAFEKLKNAGGKIRNFLVGWADASPERLKSEIYAECGNLIKNAQKRAKTAETDLYLSKNETYVERQKCRETEERNAALAEQNRKMREMLRPAPQPQRSRSKTNDRSGPGM